MFDKSERIVEALAEFGDGVFGGCDLFFGVRLGGGESGHFAVEEVERDCSGVVGFEQCGAFAFDFVQGGCGSACAFDGVGLLGVDLGTNDLSNGVDLLVRNAQSCVEVDDRVLDGRDTDMWPGAPIGGTFGAHVEEVVVAFPGLAGVPGEHHAAAAPAAGD
ncbi:hypothetical protein [Gordonia oryzae]|uniref:hypothetical protein n=1 Tax=Gordonia oryzae TaxID=2487349 RepID=UPI000F4E7CA9|nr:hypothetical protein [Gordonia oryzae]